MLHLTAPRRHNYSTEGTLVLWVRETMPHSIDLNKTTTPVDKMIVP